MNPMYVLTLVSLALVAGAAASADWEQLEQLCHLQRSAGKVSQKSEVTTLVELLGSGAVECPDKVKDAILALEQVVALDNVCSAEAADVLVDFWQKYGSKSSKERKHLPKQLKKFFLAYGMQVSRLCKRTLIAELQKATQENGITAQDIDLVARPIKANVKKMFNDDIRIENLLAIVKANRKDVDEKIAMDVSREELKFFKSQQHMCTNKMKPIYDTLIAPIVRLAAIGISYNGDEVASEMSAFEQETIYKDWFSVVVACEASLRYTMVSSSKERKVADGTAQIVTLLDEEDLAKLKKKTDLDLVEPVVVEPISYKAAPVSVADLVVDESDAELKDSLKRSKFALSAVNKFRVRMMKRIPSLMKAYVDQKVVRYSTSVEKRRGFKISRTAQDALGLIIYVLMIAGVTTGVVFAGIALHGTAAALVVVLGACIVGTMIAFLLLALAGPPRF